MREATCTNKEETEKRAGWGDSGERRRKEDVEKELDSDDCVWNVFVDIGAVGVFYAGGFGGSSVAFAVAVESELAERRTEEN
jgi:hypothetical protein